MRLRTPQARPAADLASRRSFLRRAGVTSAIAVGLAGGAEMLGLSAASAAPQRRTAKSRPQTPCTSMQHCTLAPGHCGGPCHPAGHCCYYCTSCGGGAGYQCRNTCSSSFNVCCP